MTGRGFFLSDASLLSRSPPEQYANVPERPRHSRAFHLLDSSPAGMTVSAISARYPFRFCFSTGAWQAPRFSLPIIEHSYNLFLIKFIYVDLHGIRTSLGRPPMDQPPAPRLSYAGPTTYLRCDQKFRSWDRRHNRLCPRCRQVLSTQLSDETSHALPTRRRFTPE
jgi:hypothetical protein